MVAISTTTPRSARWTTATTVLTGVAEHRLRQPLKPGPSAQAWSKVSRTPTSGAGTGLPPPPGIALPGPTPAPPTSPPPEAKDASVMGAVAVVWVFAGAISLWLLSTLGDASASRAKLRVIGLVIVGAAFATRQLRR